MRPDLTSQRDAAASAENLVLVLDVEPAAHPKRYRLWAWNRGGHALVEIVAESIEFLTIDETPVASTSATQTFASIPAGDVALIEEGELRDIEDRTLHFRVISGGRFGQFTVVWRYGRAWMASRVAVAALESREAWVLLPRG